MEMLAVGLRLPQRPDVKEENRPESSVERVELIGTGCTVCVEEKGPLPWLSSDV